ncbi:MAG: ParB/RepB/Spo0J family partition protein [Clostridia bacterium]|nr:ParB/RepB/Spo0J family partition protein [Clostridia bacterium]
MVKRRGLGRGLGVNALIPEVVSEETILKPSATLSVNEIEPNREQPRKNFDKDKLEALAESIKLHGIVQPLIVTKADGYYKIVAGERRWRAAKLAGIKDVPVIIRDYSSLEVEEIALIENLQREDLNPLEEAFGYKQLMDKFGLTQEDVSVKIGKSRPAVTNSLRLLKLPEKVQEMIKKGVLSVGHAKVLLGVENPVNILKFAEIVVERDLNVRQTEALIKQLPSKPKKEVKRDANVENAISDACRMLEKKYGTKIKVSYSSNYKGKVEISFKDLKQMTKLLEEMGK